MKQIFNETHLEVLNQMFEDSVIESVVTLEERMKMRKEEKFIGIVATTPIFKVARTVTGKTLPELFNDSANELSNKIVFYGGSTNAKTGSTMVNCKSKDLKFVFHTRAYKYTPESLTLESVGGARVITGVSYQNAKNVCKTLEKILSENESIDCTYPQLVEKVGQYFING